MPVIPEDDVIVPDPPILLAGTLPVAPCNWEILPGQCDGAWDTYPVGVQDFAISLASQTMWAATGRRYGTCELVVRPCGLWTGNANFGGSLWGNWSWGWGWGWYGFDGFFGGCGCGVNGGGWCGCVPSEQIWLPTPIAQVLQVVQDGVVVPASAYRVDDNSWLVRTDGGFWPWRQNYNVDPPAANTLEVTYLRGRVVPQPVLYAAGLLASQYAKACNGADCQLPARVTSVVRQNVSLQAIDPTLMLNNGLTGNYLVDQVIMNDNPNRIKGRRRVLSPESPITRTVTQT